MTAERKFPNVIWASLNRDEGYDLPAIFDHLFSRD